MLNKIPLFKSIIFFAIVAAIFLSGNDQKKQESIIKKIAITQILPHQSLDQIRNGIEDTLRKSLGNKIEIIYQNANGNIGTASQIAQFFASVKPAAIVSISTPSTQSMLGAKITDTPIIFAAVTNPERAKLSQKRSPNLTGVSDALPLKKQVELVKKTFELLKKDTGTVAILYSASEDNAVFQVEAFSEKLKNSGVKSKLFSVGASRDIPTTALHALNSCDIIYIGNDNQIISGIESVIKICKEHKVPLIVSDPESVKKGAFTAFTFDQYHLGVQTANLVIHALEGKIKKIQKANNAKLYINYATAKQLGIDSKIFKENF